MSYVLIAAATLIATLLTVAALKPGAFRIQRTTTIDAPAEAIFPYITNFRQWVRWSPYEKLDPAMLRIYSGPQAATGAKYEWAGNNKAGEGRMEITRIDPNTRVTLRLEFLKPFRCRNTAEFTLSPVGDSTIVTWAMFGTRPYLVKLMTTLFPMDGMLQRQFDEGLAALRREAERGTTVTASAEPR